MNNSRGLYGTGEPRGPDLRRRARYQKFTRNIGTRKSEIPIRKEELINIHSTKNLTYSDFHEPCYVGRPRTTAVYDVSEADRLNLSILLPHESIAVKIVTPSAVLVVESATDQFACRVR